jgi:hypothetical protein
MLAVGAVKGDGVLTIKKSIAWFKKERNERRCGKGRRLVLGSDGGQEVMEVDGRAVETVLVDEATRAV